MFRGGHGGWLVRSGTSGLATGYSTAMGSGVVDSDAATSTPAMTRDPTNSFVSRMPAFYPRSPSLGLHFTLTIIPMSAS